MDRSQADKEGSKTFYDRYASNYDSTLVRFYVKKLYVLVVNAMDMLEYESVLDVGCGTGNLLSEVLKRKKVAVAGIDISEGMIEVARKRLGESADLRVGDSERLPWENGSFDIVTCTESFHHYPNPKAVLLEMKRVLKPRGKIIIADPWAPTPVRQIGNFLIPIMKIIPQLNSGDVRIYSERDMKSMLEECGFTLICWERIGVAAFLLTATGK